MSEGPPPVDWQGAALDCAACRFHRKRATGRCGLGRACVHDRYAKRIERFFLINPELADECLGMPYFETRMNAPQVASVFRLPRLLADDDFRVRHAVAKCGSCDEARALLDDAEKFIRKTAAERLGELKERV